MSLTPAELAAARAFRVSQRAALEEKNATDPPALIVSVFIRNDRHDCAKRGGKSVFLELKEHYAFSPMAFVPNPPEETSPGEFVPAKRFGWIWTEGKCPQCGLTARSGTGRLVDPAIRPPSERALVSGG